MNCFAQVEPIAKNEFSFHWKGAITDTQYILSWILTKKLGNLQILLASLLFCNYFGSKGNIFPENKCTKGKKILVRTVQSGARTPGLSPCLDVFDQDLGVLQER